MMNLKLKQKEEGIYTKPSEHIADELKKIDLILKLGVLRLKTKKKSENDFFSGLYISEEEIDTLLNKNGSPFQNSSDENDLIQAITKQRMMIEKKLSHSKEAGVILPIDHLKRIFGLTSLEIDILFICLAPYVDSKYDKIYAYIQDDVTKQFPTLQLIFLLFTQNIEERFIVRDYCSYHAPLIQWRLITYGIIHEESSISPLSKPLTIDARIVDFLLGSIALDGKTAKHLHVIQSEKTLYDLQIHKSLKQKFMHMVDQLKNSAKFINKTILYFFGPTGCGKTEATAAIAKALNIPILMVELRTILQNESAFIDMFHRSIREAVLFQSALIIKDFDILLTDEAKHLHHRNYVLQEIENFLWLTFLTGEKKWEGMKNIISVQFPIPDQKMRKKVWEHNLKEFADFYVGISSDELAGKFHFTQGQIRNAIAAANNFKIFCAQDEHAIDEASLLKGCRIQCNHKLSELASKLEPKYIWDDIVLPEDQFAQLKEICSQFRYRHVVYDTWGFGKKASLGKGLNILFSGPPGTGKTMAADIIANELELEIYKIDLSQIVSKYIGETEKNLNRIFKEAESSNAILFFDEADALFGKRSEVKDAHDRYANIEIGYLLQKMEEYEGMTILATNLRQNIDEAFVRRMHFIVDFPFPDENLRKQIWKGIFPKEAPIAQDMDYDFLGNHLKIAGGYIKNIALSAAVYAAEESSKIGMSQLMRAAKREYRKIGNTFLKTDFEPYYELLEENKQ